MLNSDNKQECIKQFSVERQEDSLFIVKNNTNGTFIIATNFDANTASYTGRVFDTVESLESALKIFESAKNEMSANKKAGVLC